MKKISFYLFFLFLFAFFLECKKDKVYGSPWIPNNNGTITLHWGQTPYNLNDVGAGIHYKLNSQEPLLDIAAFHGKYVHGFHELYWMLIFPRVPFSVGVYTHDQISTFDIEILIPRDSERNTCQIYGIDTTMSNENWLEITSISTDSQFVQGKFHVHMFSKGGGCDNGEPKVELSEGSFSLDLSN
jgi:hypothetical protein